MSESSNIFSLPDHAVVAYFAIREFRTTDVPALCLALGKSPASIYRSLSVLRDAGVIKKQPRFNVIAGDYTLSDIA